MDREHSLARLYLGIINRISILHFHARAVAEGWAGQGTHRKATVQAWGSLQEMLASRFKRRGTS